MKPGTPPLQSTRLLDQVRERVRHMHYSLSTEQVYLYWVRFFIRWHGLRHPRDMGTSEVEAFLAKPKDATNSIAGHARIQCVNG